MSAVVAISSGEPAGIGPDILIKLAQKPRAARLLVFGDPDVFMDRARQLALPLEIIQHKPSLEISTAASCLSFVPVKCSEKVTAGILNPENAGYVLSCIEAATSSCLDGLSDAMVTAPVHKGVINDAGIPFTGHTEFIAELTNTPRVVMMLATEGLRVALATTHLPLSLVSSALNRKDLLETISILDKALSQYFCQGHPRILLCGLNPHAGENGHLGREEIEILQPAVDSARNQGINISDPLPADTLFSPHNLENSDAVLSMYHDQGLPVLKYKGFGKAVNITLGLPLIRTSVDHGTALDLAGTGRASTGSLEYAITTAVEMHRMAARQ